MPRILRFAIASVFLLTAFLHADDWAKTYQVKGKPEFHFATGDANIRIEPWDKNSIEVHLVTVNWTIGEDGLRVSENQSGDVVSVEVITKGDWNFSWGHSNGRRADVHVFMPREARLDIKTGDGRIGIDGIKGDIRLRSGDGRQEVRKVEGTLHSASGDGRIELEGRFDSLEAASGDGHITARVLPGSRISSSWMLSAHDGSVDLILPRDMPADVELRSGDGHINVDVPMTISGGNERHVWRGKLNGGGGLLTVHTGDGSIRLSSSRMSL